MLLTCCQQSAEPLVAGFEAFSMSTAVELASLAADKSICHPQPRTILCQGLSTLELRVLGVRRLKRPSYAVHNCPNIYSGLSLSSLLD